MFAQSGGLRSHWSAPWCQCVYTKLNAELNSTGAVSTIKTEVADGILNQRLAGAEPTLFSDLLVTSITVSREQVWLIRPAGTQAHFPLTFQNISEGT